MKRHFLVTILLVVFSMLTCFRNVVWKSDVILWEDVVKKGTEKLRSYNNLGYAYYNQGWQDRSIQVYILMASKLELEPALIHNSLGVNYYSQGKLDKAIEEFLFALNLNPNDAEIHYNLGNVYADKGLRDKAVEEYKITLRLKPDFIPAQKALQSLHFK